MKKSFWKDNLPLLVGMAVTAAAVTAAGILFHQSFFRILPLYVSLIVALLQSRMIRYASLLGGINSILYALVYAGYRLYGSAAYALLVSCPIQLVTFVLWSRKPWGQSTVFRRMPAKGRILTAGGFALALLLTQLILRLTGGEHVFLDSLVTLLGILTAFLTMLSYREYTVLMVAGGILSAALYLTMLPEHPEQTTYLVFGIYSLICSVTALFRIRKLCREQEAMAGKPVA